MSDILEALELGPFTEGWLCLVAGNHNSVSQRSVTIRKAQGKQLIKRKGLFWLPVLEASIHDELAVYWRVHSIIGSGIFWSVEYSS
jgi:hypothetical protein